MKNAYLEMASEGTKIRYEEMWEGKQTEGKGQKHYSSR
jgi:hypothetical protein